MLSIRPLRLLTGRATERAVFRGTRGAIVFALMVAIAVNAALAQHAGEAIEAIKSRELELFRQALILEGEAPELLSDGRGYLLTRDQRFLDDFAEDRDDARAALARLRKLVLTPDGSTLVDTIGGELDAAISDVERRIALAQQGRPDEARAGLTEAQDTKSKLFSSLDALVEREEALLRGRLS